VIVASATLADDCATVFTGEIPNFSKCVALEKLDLSWNKLSGKPTTIASCRSWHLVAGPIPDFFKCVALQHLWLDNIELMAG
jgi:hypothetical protein